MLEAVDRATFLVDRHQQRELGLSLEPKVRLVDLIDVFDVSLETNDSTGANLSQNALGLRIRRPSLKADEEQLSNTFFQREPC